MRLGRALANQKVSLQGGLTYEGGINFTKAQKAAGPKAHQPKKKVSLMGVSFMRGYDNTIIVLDQLHIP